MKLISKISKATYYLNYKILRILRIFFNINQSLYIDGKKLILPPDHLFTHYEKVYPSYDKFLVNLINGKHHLNIIDIGANVGDTFLRIISDNNNYYCIEPNEFFLKYLKLNVNNNIDRFKNVKVKIINELVGDQLEGFLNQKNGTASLSKHSEINKKKYSKKLDEIISENNIKKVDLIKSDTDGYDINVLKSGFKSIKKNKPILFFEYMNVKSTQLNDYLDFISKLKLVGYNSIIILSNNGEIILQDNNIQKIEKVMKNKYIVDICCSITEI